MKFVNYTFNAYLVIEIGGLYEKYLFYVVNL
jgi:hypothetical protein